MHPATIIGTFRSLIVDVAMGQIPRSTERISSYYYYYYYYYLLLSVSINIHSRHGFDKKLSSTKCISIIYADTHVNVFIFV